ncbi:uncharacterized protein LAESUDRAFT_644956 [Laetiporus sulphureus 93-53]|uniref:cAMP-independent regulatory protein pac2 n=1 Tax=Laetiporus sulphureus 93-53 TaxID=1314785 RepID=A0A165GF45_9APHY|nr:uncharacterized protein LAESUDRAFT_644956 [Laetiporus sulphureus 93-53]KZT10265.1 hypothetical protein LAESUDRAFT_644956 [Laetiporus sulphureus 93-53]
MQQPTLQNVRIRSTRDACQIFYAVAHNVLPMTTRRLDAEERRAITSGNVYIWEERCANAEATGMGMERWTDGMGWGPSRVRDEFLFYHQRENDTNDDPSHPSARWANMMRRREPRPGSLPYSRSDTERLIKQTYSVHVSLPEDRPRGITRKWHLTAYFSQSTLDSLGTIDEIPNVGDVQVPEGWFKSARANKAKRNESNSGDELSSAQDPWGLGLHSSNHGLSQFPVESVPGAQEMRLIGSSYMPPAIHASPSSYSYALQVPHHHQTVVVPGATVYSTVAVGQRLPTLHDSGLHSYRDPSPLNLSGLSTASSSSSSSDRDPSPRPFSSPLSPPPLEMRPSPTQVPRTSKLELVPLSILQGTPPPLRDPLDEQFLRKFSASGIAGAEVPRSYSTGASPNPRHIHGHGGFSEDLRIHTPLRADSWSLR